MNLNGKKLIFVSLLLIYSGFMIVKCAYMSFNSDDATNILIANDLLHRNFFLSNWKLGSRLDLTTEFPYHIVGLLVTGISAWVYPIAAGAMVVATVMIGFCLCQPSKRTLSSLAFYFLICAVPGAFGDKSFSYHLPAITWSFLSLLFAAEEFEQHRPRHLLWVAIFLLLGCFGNALSFPVGPLPILIYCLAKRLSRDCSPDEANACKRIITVVVAAIVLSTILQQVYFYIGQVGKPIPMIKTLSFEPLEKLGEKIVLYIRSIFVIGDADFFGKPVFGKRIVDSAGGAFMSILRGEIHLAIKTPAYFVHTFVIIIGFILVFRNIRDFIRGKDTDRLSILLSIGIICISLIFILTTVAVDEPSRRYVAYIWIAFGVLIARNWEWLISSTRLTTKSAAVGLLLMATLAFGFRAVEDCIEIARRDGFPEPAQKALGEFLRHNGLYEGYSSFWNASVTTVALKNQVKVRPVISSNEKIEPFVYLCKQDWYKEPANFVVAADDDMFGVTPQNVIGFFGRPKNVLGFESWKILIYDTDLSAML